MKYTLLKDIIKLIEEFEADHNTGAYSADVDGFRKWSADSLHNRLPEAEPDWEGKEKGRSAESVINTLVVHMNRYAKMYSKAAIYNSDFSTQEEFIYLINLKAFGEMTKMELIKKNIQDKPSGMQIIARLINQGWVMQKDSDIDRRSKILAITDKGVSALEKQMDKIRHATRIVTGDLTQAEKMELIRLLTKLDHFHKPIFLEHPDNSRLLEWISTAYPSTNN